MLRSPSITLFAVLSLVCITAIAIGMGSALSYLLTGAVSEFEWHAIATIAEHEAHEVSLEQMFSGSLHADARDRLGHEFARRLVADNSRIQRVKIWGLDGTVVWSDKAELIGGYFPDNDALRRTLSGRMVVDLPDLTEAENISEREDFRAVAEVYIPVKSGDAVLGVLEIYTDPNRLFASIRRGRVAIWSISGIGGLVLCLLLLPILRSAYQRHAAYAEQLEHAVAQRTEALAQAQQQLIRQERLRALGQMASGIAHDFNNALTPVLAGAELLLGRPDLLAHREKAEHYLRRIKTGAEDASSVVGRLREFYRQRDESDVLSALDVNQIIEQAISLTKPKWESEALAISHPISVKTDLGVLPPIAGNEAELREMLTNLIFNAVDAMPDGGILTVRSRLEPRWEEATSSAADSGPMPQAVVEVCDTGIGMTEKVRQRCLEPFFSTKGDRGSGLGLAMAFGTIQRHGGSIQIESAPDQGTRVSVYLPVRTPKETEPVVDPGRLTRSLRILLIEDDPACLETLEAYLTGDGHAVVTGNDGREALQKLREGQFDVVVTDRAMPLVGGDQVASISKTMAPDLPVIMLTGFGSLMEAAGEVPAAVDLIVAKPVTISKLRHALATVNGSPGGPTPRRATRGASGAA